MREYLLYIKVGTESAGAAQAYVTPCFSVDQSFWQEREGCLLHVIGKSPSLALAFSLREIVNARLQENEAAARPMSEAGLAELRKLAVSSVRETAALYGREAGGQNPLQSEWFAWEAGEVTVVVSRRDRAIGAASGVNRDTTHAETFEAAYDTIHDGAFHVARDLAHVAFREAARDAIRRSPRDALLSRQASPSPEALLCDLLEGRALLWEEVETMLAKKDAVIPDVTAALHRMVLSEAAEWRPGIRFSVKKSWWKHRLELICDRCGSERKDIELTVCHSCGQGCAYCTVCLGMGRSKCCTPYIWVRGRAAVTGSESKRRQQASRLHWTGSYSTDQAVAAEQARRFAANPRPGMSQFLIWAVCGAGKTELLFPSIAEALAAGGRVLIATPRKDVVLELAPRLQRVFPHARVIAVHGSSLEKWEDAEITIATTHQVMRFYQRFPLVVLDEADAFPYHNNPVLYRAVARAVQPAGKLLYLTATPPRYLQKTLVAKGAGRLGSRSSLPSLRSSTHVLLPGRYHGSALPVPQVVTVRGLHKRLRTKRPIAPLLELVRSSFHSKRQLFLFVPRVNDVDLVLSYLAHFFPEDSSQLAGVHAADPLREEKVRAFREKRCRVMVTTTILERGVTIPRSDVAVIGAEAPVFDEASLVQIAGRVGRSFDDPTGTVLFLQEDRAASPRAAVGQIRRMNQLALTMRSRVEQA